MSMVKMKDVVEDELGFGNGRWKAGKAPSGLRLESRACAKFCQLVRSFLAASGTKFAQVLLLLQPRRQGNSAHVLVDRNIQSHP